MNISHFAALRRLLLGAASRRDVLGALGGGLLAAGPLVHLVDYSEARRKRKGKRKRGKKKRKNNKGNGPVTRADATCSGQRANIVTDAAGDIRFAQTFRAEKSGQLLRVELEIEGDGEAEDAFIVRLATVDDSGIPTNEVLAESSVSGAGVPDEPANISFSFDDPATVKAGAEYALVLSRPGGDLFAWSVTNLDTCSGQSFSSINGTASFQIFEADLDFIFTAFVRS